MGLALLLGAAAPAAQAALVVGAAAVVRAPPAALAALAEQVLAPQVVQPVEFQGCSAGRCLWAILVACSAGRAVEHFVGGGLTRVKSVISVAAACVMR